MAKLSREDILKLAKLAKLKLDEDEISQFQSEISDILDYVEQLQSVKLEGLAPTNQVTGLSNVTRPDKVIDYGTTPEQLLKNAPATKAGQIKVRRVL